MINSVKPHAMKDAGETCFMQVSHCEKTRCIVELFQYKHPGSWATIYPTHWTDKTHFECLLLLNTAFPGTTIQNIIQQ